MAFRLENVCVLFFCSPSIIFISAQRILKKRIEDLKSLRFHFFNIPLLKHIILRSAQRILKKCIENFKSIRFHFFKILSLKHIILRSAQMILKKCIEDFENLQISFFQHSNIKTYHFQMLIEDFKSLRFHFLDPSLKNIIFRSAQRILKASDFIFSTFHH